MNNIFVISDTHFGHKKIIDFESEFRTFDSIEDHDDELVRRWNQVVGKKDTVWHLGDVLFGQDAFKTIGKLNGVKKLVMGNHDRYPSRKYLDYFSNIYGSYEYKGFIMTHIPVHEDQLKRYKGNIHGHLHSNKLLDERYICVSAEQVNLTPYPLDRIIKSR